MHWMQIRATLIWPGVLGAHLLHWVGIRSIVQSFSPVDTYCLLKIVPTLQWRCFNVVTAPYTGWVYVLLNSEIFRMLSKLSKIYIFKFDNQLNIFTRPTCFDVKENFQKFVRIWLSIVDDEIISHYSIFIQQNMKLFEQMQATYDATVRACSCKDTVHTPCLAEQPTERESEPDWETTDCCLATWKKEKHII